MTYDFVGEMILSTRIQQPFFWKAVVKYYHQKVKQRYWRHKTAKMLNEVS